MRVVVGVALAVSIGILGIWTIFAVLTYVLMPFIGAILGMVTG